MIYDTDDLYDMKKVLTSPEWNVYKKFLSNRVLQLKDKLLTYVRAGNTKEAEKILAVIDDIQRQVDLFKQARIDLENEPLKEE